MSETYKAFEELVKSLHGHPTNREQRLGQVYFNVLLSIRPDIAEKMRGTMFDPFHRDEIHPKVRDFVLTHWGNK